MSASPREIIERHRQAVLALDMAAQAELFAEDGVLEFPFAPAGAPSSLIGREQIHSLAGECGRVLAGGTTTSDCLTYTTPAGWQLAGFFGRSGSEVDRLAPIYTRLS